MTPTVIHRYTISIQQAIVQLLGKQATESEAFAVAINGDDLLIDIHGPAIATQSLTNEMAKSNVASPEADAEPLNKSPKPDMAPAEPPRKGGALARQAGIMCGEKGFWTFLAKRFGAAISTADDAANWLREDCAIKTRADLDYEPAAAERFKEISRRYGLWLEGYDD